MAAGLTLVPMVTVDTRDVRVADLVRDADRERLDAATAARVVLRLPAGQRQVTLPGPVAAALIRRAGVVATGTAPVRITIRAVVRGAANCWTSTRSLAVGETITIDDVAPAACNGESVAIGFVGGVPTVRDTVVAGAALGRLVPATAGRVAPGTALTLRSIAGPVTIERSVTTMQAGRSGRRVFVRDGEGQVVAAPLALVEDAR
ncbi:hypothetical protein ASE86_14495 [Sphingomonas sp. Leaf33]|nr:hypothetical protein ASE86_14495 [Sphingomonas sp. Leaf33]